MKTELIDLSFFMEQLFPPEVVSSYASFIKAEEDFEKAKKEFAPKAPFKNGEFILFDRWADGNWKEGKISGIRYSPYSSGNGVGAWAVTILPLKKGFKLFDRVTVNTIRLTKSCLIKRLMHE